MPSDVRIYLYVYASITIFAIVVTQKKKNRPEEFESKIVFISKAKIKISRGDILLTFLLRYHLHIYKYNLLGVLYRNVNFLICIVYTN